MGGFNMIWDGEGPKMMGMVSRCSVVTVMDIDLDQIDGHIPRNCRFTTSSWQVVNMSWREYDD